MKKVKCDHAGESKQRDHFHGAQDALNRMKRAADRGTGCHLTAEMIRSLSCTEIGGVWEQPDPRVGGGPR